LTILRDFEDKVYDAYIVFMQEIITLLPIAINNVNEYKVSEDGEKKSVLCLATKTSLYVWFRYKKRAQK
jgi:hypothetical protein